VSKLYGNELRCLMKMIQMWGCAQMGLMAPRVNKMIETI
jgi:hypothetical protein